MCDVLACFHSKVVLKSHSRDGQLSTVRSHWWFLNCTSVLLFGPHHSNPTHFKHNWFLKITFCAFGLCKIFKSTEGIDKRPGIQLIASVTLQNCVYWVEKTNQLKIINLRTALFWLLVNFCLLKDALTWIKCLYSQEVIAKPQELGFVYVITMHLPTYSFAWTGKYLSVHGRLHTQHNKPISMGKSCAVHPRDTLSSLHLRPPPPQERAAAIHNPLPLIKQGGDRISRMQ